MGLFEPSQLAEALKVVEENFDRYFKISAVRARVSQDRSITKQKGYDFEVCNLAKEEDLVRAKEAQQGVPADRARAAREPGG